MSRFSIPDDVLAQLARAQRVSDGELKALKLALNQRKSKEIAQELGISEAATRKRLGEVYRKFGIKGKGPGKLASLERQLMAAMEDDSSQQADAHEVPLLAPRDLAKKASQQVFDSEQRPLADHKGTGRSHLSLIEGALDQAAAQRLVTGASRAKLRHSLPASPDLATQYCWNNAPALNLFQGRREVLATLKHWILQPADAHKLLAICGIGGIGKTSLARKLVEDLDGYFEQVVWLTARTMQTPSELLQVLLEVLPTSTSSGYGQDLPSAEMLAEGDLASPQSVQLLIQRLIECFSQQPCLVVIDGFEAVFRGGQEGAVDKSDSPDLDVSDSLAPRPMNSSLTPTFESSRRQQASLYRDELQAYGDLFEALRQPVALGQSASAEAMLSPLEKGAAIGMSCLILTSREKPRELLSIPEGDPLSYLYTLDGLQDYEAARMLSQFRLRGQAADYKALVDRYYGHPMALRLAANAVKDMFYGRIRDFLDQEISVFDDLRSVLKTQFRRLSSAEVEVMYWLAVNHVACTLEDLQADVVSQDLKQNLLYVLQSLERRFLVQVQPGEGGAFDLHPIVAEYVLSRFIREIFQDLIQGDLSLFNRHALMKADAEESCRQFQKECIVLPILERLRNYFKSLFQVDEYLNEKLTVFRENNAYRLGYAGGNFVNLMVALSQGKLSRKDFSKLTIWQAYLQGTQLREVNFTRCELNRSVFTETVSDVMTIAVNDLARAVEMPPMMACGDTHGMVHIWLTSTAAEVSTSAGQKCAEWSAHNGWVRSLTFLHTQSCLLTGGDDNTLKLWQLPVLGQQTVNQPRLLWKVDTSDWVHAIALNPDESVVAIGGENKITLYSSTTGKALGGFLHQPAEQMPVGQIPADDLPADDSPANDLSANARAYPSSPLTTRRSVRSLTFSLDGQWLASSGDDDVIRLWAVSDLMSQQSGELIVAEGRSTGPIPIAPAAEFTQHSDLVRSVRFSPDSRYLLSGCDDGTVRAWPVASENLPGSGDLGRHASVAQGKAASQILTQESDRIRAIAISPDSQLLAVGCDDCQVKLWNLQTRQLLETVTTHRSRIWSMAFQQQGPKLMLAAGGDRQTVMLWQVHASYASPEKNTQPEHLQGVTVRPVRTYRGYTNGIRAVSFLGAQHIVSGGDNRDLSVWSRTTGERKATLSMHQGRIWAIAVDTQNARIASASDDHTIGLWDANTGQCLTTFAEHTSWVRTVAFSRRGRFLASSGDDCTIRIWNTASGFCLKSLRYSTHWIHSVCFDPTNSRYLISGGDDKIVRCWDRKEGISRSLAVHDHRICSVAYSPNGELVASGSDDNTVVLWDMVDGKMMHRFTQPDLGIKAVAFSPDGRYLAAGGEDQLVYLWDLQPPGDLQPPEKICHLLRFQSYSGVTGGIRSLAFSPDGQSIISAGLDETIRICDLRELNSTVEAYADESSLPVFTALIQPERPYENIAIEGVKGLSHLQVSNLLSLGAVNQKTSLFL